MDTLLNYIPVPRGRCPQPDCSIAAWALCCLSSHFIPVTNSVTSFLIKFTSSHNPFLLIAIQSLSKSFKGFQAVKNVSLHIRSNEYVALLGPNGAGKTTLVEMI